MAARRILESIYEADFLDTSRGYRSGKGARHASQMLREEDDVKLKVRPDVVYMRYADDFVCGFNVEKDALRFLEWLKVYGLELAEEKSGVVKFSRFDVEGSGKFTFLGFDFYWARTRKGGRTVKRRTNAKKMNESLHKMKNWIRDNHSSTLKKLCESLKRKLQGHNNYYGVIGNAKSVSKYHYHCLQIVFKWLNRRSQRQSYNWHGFNEMWKSCAMPPPRIVEGPYEPQSRLDLSYVYA